MAIHLQHTIMCHVFLKGLQVNCTITFKNKIRLEIKKKGSQEVHTWPAANGVYKIPFSFEAK